MNVPYRVYDVFADTPFAGTQIAVVLTDHAIEERLKLQIAAEFSHSATVFLNSADQTSPFSVYNRQGRTTFGAHTILAAAQTAHDLGMSQAAQGYFEYSLRTNGVSVSTFVDTGEDKPDLTLYSRAFDFTTDRFVPDQASLAAALSMDLKHLRYSRYKSRLVCADTPVLVVPVTRPEHVVNARLDTTLWSSLLSDIYAQAILLIAPGSVSGHADFHGRLIHPDFTPAEYPPIGSVIPEFVAYLCSEEGTAKGTHSVSIDRGSYDSRQSLIHVEFDYTGGQHAKCRIGGKVVLMSEGRFIYH